jgi:hypothetical protein
MLEKMQTGGQEKPKRRNFNTAALLAAGLAMGATDTALAAKQVGSEMQTKKPIEQEAGVNYAQNKQQQLEKKHDIKIIAPNGSLTNLIKGQHEKIEMTEKDYKEGWEEAVGTVIKVPDKGGEFYAMIHYMPSCVGQYAKNIGKASGLMFAMEYEGSHSALEKYKTFYKEITDKIVNNLGLSAEESDMDVEVYLKNNSSDKIKELIRYVGTEKVQPMNGEKAGDWAVRMVGIMLGSIGVNEPPKPPSR